MDSEKFLEKVRFKNFSEPPLVLCYYRNERVAPFKFVVPRTQTCHARGRPLQLVGAAGGVVVSAEGGVLNRYISGWAGMGADTLFAKRGIDHDTCVRIYIYIYMYIHVCAHTYTSMHKIDSFSTHKIDSFSTHKMNLELPASESQAHMTNFRS